MMMDDVPWLKIVKNLEHYVKVKRLLLSSSFGKEINIDISLFSHMSSQCF